MEVEDPRARLSLELEAALIREVRAEFHRLNAAHFKGALKPPTLMLSDAASRLGRFDSASRTLELARRLATKEPWATLVEVLKHEMAHQYVFEVLHIQDESAHGPAFRDVCERLAIDARAAGMPPADTRTDEEERVLGRIAKLLALAESPSQHEAEAAMNAAQRLMLKYNLEAAALRGAGSGAASYTYRTLGTPTGRVTEAERLLSAILGEHFFVEVIWVPVYRPLEGKRGSVLEVSGTPANLEMASYVHSFLSHAAARLWLDHRRAQRIRSNRDRRTFLSGVMAGFFAKLESERTSQKQSGLVWVGDPALHKYYRRRHPHVSTVRYGGGARNDAHQSGREAGQRLVLHRPVTAGPTGGVKLLGR